MAKKKRAKKAPAKEKKTATVKEKPKRVRPSRARRTMIVPVPTAAGTPLPTEVEADAKAREQMRREAVNIYRKAESTKGRDIAPLPYEQINWDRRLACKEDPKLFCEEYGKTVFFLGWAEHHLECLEVARDVFLHPGVKHSFAMPRGSGKTSISRFLITWGTAYAHKRYPFFISSTQPAAIQALDFVKTYWTSHEKLREDFPEIGYPIYRLEGRSHLARGQLYDGESTHISWGSEELRYPSLLLNDEIARHYLDHDPDSVVWIEDKQMHIPASAGTIIQTAGIDGSLRGKNETHPVTLEQLRPDIVLLDDVQKDQKAESPTSCEKMILLIDGAIDGMAGPDASLSALMPCTVIRQGDVSDTYLNPMHKPEWQGIRTQMVSSWPPGITDFEITQETDSSRMWLEYAELRTQSLRLYGDTRKANDFYEENREILDLNFNCTWTDRFNKKGKNKEISAQQNAMNLRLKSPVTFPSEYQNIGRMDDQGTVQMMTAEQLIDKVLPLQECCVPTDTQHIATFIDVQDEILFECTVACSTDFTGVVTHYDTYPKNNALGHFTKSQTMGWNMLSRDFFKVYPHYKNDAHTIKGGKKKAPREEKIYWAVTEAVKRAQQRIFIQQDGQDTVRHTQKIAVDARWGEVSDAIKRAVRDLNDPNVYCWMGRSIPPTNKQYEEYTRSGQFKHWLFEDQRHPSVENVKWVYKPGADGRYFLEGDVDRLKDFLFARLTTSRGGQGSISLYQPTTPEKHSLFAHHICNSEYPEPVEAKGIKKNKWMERDGRPDNDWFDCFVGCMALLSHLGAHTSLATTDKPPAKRSRSLSRLRELKQRRNSR